ncbi:hypothetical protein RvY_04559 [Ramazzottius varieornatus]|uniref:MADF domain-containing protein n=1 Tax=Ramazzottius varieornatus TaxID=947166 RepID=A0A1D1US27_RAMVA|nr:hypothetical protein RvY_04559 [Ramazzottius varieornatus]
MEFEGRTVKKITAEVRRPQVRQPPITPWTFEKEEQLIDLVHQHPALWNRLHHSYYSIDKSMLYLDLATRLGIAAEACFGPNGRWKKLRDVYSQKLKDGTSRTWGHTKSMSFLGDNIRNRHYYYRRNAVKMGDDASSLQTPRERPKPSTTRTQVLIEPEQNDEELEADEDIAEVEDSSEVSLEEAVQAKSHPDTSSLPQVEVSPSNVSRNADVDNCLLLLSTRLRALPESLQDVFWTETTKFLNVLENQSQEQNQPPQLVLTEHSPAAKLSRLLASLPDGVSLDPALLPALLGIS